MKTISSKTVNDLEQLKSWPFKDIVAMEKYARQRSQKPLPSGIGAASMDYWYNCVKQVEAEIARRFNTVQSVAAFCHDNHLIWPTQQINGPAKAETPLTGPGSRVHNALHQLWTWAVGQPGYHKGEWQALESEIAAAVKAAAQLTTDHCSLSTDQAEAQTTD